MKMLMSEFIRCLAVWMGHCILLHKQIDAQKWECREIPGTDHRNCYLATCDAYKTYWQVSRRCMEEGGSLAMLDSQQESDFIMEKQLFTSGYAWIGITRPTTESWHTVSLPWTNWDTGEPNGIEEPCVQVIPNLRWQDIMCELSTLVSPNIAICHRTYGACRMFRGTVTCYWDTCAMTNDQTAASASCSAAGGELATIGSQQEAAFVRNAVKLSNSAWLGIQTTEEIAWSDLATSTLSERCIIINKEYELEASSCISVIAHPSLCKSEQGSPVCFNDSGHITCFWQSYDRSYNRSSAQAVCAREGGSLVKLYKQRIVDFIINNLNLGSELTWTGMKKNSTESWNTLPLPSGIYWSTEEPQNGNCLLLTANVSLHDSPCRITTAIPGLCMLQEGTEETTQQTTQADSTIDLTKGNVATTEPGNSLDLKTTRLRAAESVSTTNAAEYSIAHEIMSSKLNPTTEPDFTLVGLETRERSMTTEPNASQTVTEANDGQDEAEAKAGQNTTEANADQTVTKANDGQDEPKTNVGQTTTERNASPAVTVSHLEGSNENVTKESNMVAVSATTTNMTIDTAKTKYEVVECYDSTTCTSNYKAFNILYEDDAQKWLENRRHASNVTLIKDALSDETGVKRLPKFLTGPLIMQVFNDSKPPGYWSKGPSEAPLAPAVGSLMMIFLAAEIAFVLLMDANHLRKHAKLWWRNVRRLNKRIVKHRI